MLFAEVSGSGLVAVVGIGAAVGLVVFFVGMQADERSVVRSSLRRLEGYEVENVRDQELLKPVRERAVAPAIEKLTDLGRRFTPTGYVDKVRMKFVYAGEPSPDAVDRFLATQVMGVVIAVVVSLFALFALEGLFRWAVVGFALLLGFLGPSATLNRKVEDRQHQLRVKLPDVLDLLTISVEAGLGFEQALDRTVAAVPGPLSEEFARMLGEVRAGSSRADAMRAMELRCNVPEVRSFVLAILQADTFGVSIGRVLRAQADEMRIRRRQLAQEQAQKAPVKMLIPMVFCIFPALFVIVLGPAVINIYQKF
ncbi:MAG TPA: type II secretion system F family protein [Acidimicrobiales bacterium]|nr:type II secretion system F family protein [Acidimicrobiales bacterium]